MELSYYRTGFIKAVKLYYSSFCDLFSYLNYVSHETLDTLDNISLTLVWILGLPQQTESSYMVTDEGKTHVGSRVFRYLRFFPNQIRIWWHGKAVMVTRQDELRARQAIDLVNAKQESTVVLQHTDGVKDFTITVPRRTHRRGTYDIVMTVKFSNPGIEIDTGANRLVAKRLLYNAMRDADWRTVDIAKQLPIALEMVFIPTDEEIIAHRVRASATLAARHREHESVKFARDRPSIWYWFGRVNRSKPISEC
jgi:hypothetical protein